MRIFLNCSGVSSTFDVDVIMGVVGGKNTSSTKYQQVRLKSE